MTAIKGDGGGYVAIDDFEFLHSAEDNEFCKIKPDSATPTTSTVPPTSTGDNKHFPILFLWGQFQNYQSYIHFNIVLSLLAANFESFLEILIVQRKNHPHVFTT